MKLLQLDNLFFTKRVIIERKGQGFGDKSTINENKSTYGAETNYVGKGDADGKSKT